MVKLITKILLGALALLIAAEFVPGIEIDSVYIAIITAIILGVINLVIRPILILLTFPITLLTFGLFSFVINAALFWFASTFIQGFDVSGFVAALLGSIITSLVTTIGNKFL